ncbi:MAG TPA: carbon storage regulator [Planctomycetaceae bacterium]|nr:carbon storage regulator [Planctomycetaceae bacterium]
MLVLSRKIGESIRIGAEIDLVVLDVSRGRVKLGFVGPKQIPIRRGEIEELPNTIKMEETVPAELPRPCSALPCSVMAGDGEKPAFAPLRAFRKVGGI